MLFNSLEKVERNVYQLGGNVSLKVQVNLGKKSFKDSNRLSADYVKEYNSQKYSDRNTLTSLSVNTNDFLILQYADKNAFNEVYLSYPHLKKFVEGFIKAKLLVVDNYDQVFIEEDDSLFLNSNFSNYCISIDGLVGGKSIKMYPDVIDDQEFGLMPGLAIFIGSQEYMGLVDFEKIEAFAYFLEKEFNFTSTCQNLINFSATHILYTQGSNGGGHQQPVSNNSTPTQKAANHMANRSRRVRTVQPKQNSLANEFENVANTDEQQPEQQIIETNPEPRVPQRAVPSRSSLANRKPNVMPRKPAVGKQLTQEETEQFEGVSTEGQEYPFETSTNTSNMNNINPENLFDDEEQKEEQQPVQEEVVVEETVEENNEEVSGGPAGLFSLDNIKKAADTIEDLKPEELNEKESF